MRLSTRSTTRASRHPGPNCVRNFPVTCELTPALGSLGPAARLQALALPASIWHQPPGLGFTHQWAGSSPGVYWTLTLPTSEAGLVPRPPGFHSRLLWNPIPPTSGSRRHTRQDLETNWTEGQRSLRDGPHSHGVGPLKDLHSSQGGSPRAYGLNVGGWGCSCDPQDISYRRSLLPGQEMELTYQIRKSTNSNFGKMKNGCRPQ